MYFQIFRPRKSFRASLIGTEVRLFFRVCSTMNKHLVPRVETTFGALAALPLAVIQIVEADRAVRHTDMCSQLFQWLKHSAREMKRNVILFLFIVPRYRCVTIKRRESWRKNRVLTDNNFPSDTHAVRWCLLPLELLDNSQLSLSPSLDGTVVLEAVRLAAWASTVRCAQEALTSKHHNLCMGAKVIVADTRIALMGKAGVSLIHCSRAEPHSLDE